MRHSYNKCTPPARSCRIAVTADLSFHRTSSRYRCCLQLCCAGSQFAMVPYKLPSAEAVRDAALLLSSMVFATPVKGSLPLTNLANENLENSKCVKKLSQIELFFKCENLQYTGSFKFRGACHFLAKLDNLALSNGVVAYSTGKAPLCAKTHSY